MTNTVKTQIVEFLTTKKLRYAFYSVLLAFGLFYVSSITFAEEVLIYSIFGIVVLGFIGSILSKNFPILINLFYGILPFHLIAGYLISLYYFPNFGLLIKVSAFISLCLVSYIVFLINNIFAVVKEKGSLIPLYDVAMTWIQIIMIVISIPYIAGIYKVQALMYVQHIIVFMSLFLFNLYMIWGLSYDPDIIKTSFSEKLSLAALMSFLTSVLGVAISFFPTESFLRGLFISSLLLFNLSYIQNHYKNRLNLRLLIEYSIIAFIFFLLVLLFKP